MRLKNNLRVLNFLFLFLFLWVFIFISIFPPFFFHLVKKLRINFLFLKNDVAFVGIILIFLIFSICQLCNFRL